jgi:6-phosphogluconolactonase
MYMMEGKEMNPVISAIFHCVVGCNAGATDGQTLHILKCNSATGEMELVQTVKGVQGTNYFCFDRNRENLYTYIGETVGDSKRGTIVKFPFKDGRLGEMKRLASLPSEAPCHISLSPDGNRLGFACYGSATAGTVGVDGSDLVTVVHDNEGLGTDEKRQDKAHAHCSVFTKDGKYVGIVDLGKDRILFYEAETMTPVPSMTVRTDPGDGPRHAIWSKDGRFLFVVNELGNSVMSFAFDGRTFSRVGKWSTLPEGFSEWSKAAAIKLTADGSVLMASNRGYEKNSIALYAVDKEKGKLTLRNVAAVDGVFPRDFELTPDEKYMIVGHKRSNEVCMYRFDRSSFALEPVGKRIEIWNPLCFLFAPIVIKP